MIREYEQAMPPDIMNTINQFDWKRELREIVRDNNLMLDVGSDLEESVYMMILGAVKVEDVYLRLIEVHEIADEKAQKVLREVEERIFNPLFEQLSKLPGDEDDGVEITEDEPVVGSTKISRDSILAEIETDVEIERPANNIVMPGGRTLPPASMEKVSVMPGMGGQPPVTMTESAPQAKAEPQIEIPPAPKQPLSDRLGLRDIPAVAPKNMSKPFMMGDSNTVEVRKTAIVEGVISPGVINPISIPPAPVPSTAIPSQGIPVGMQPGIQADPIASGLTAPTATAAPQAQQSTRPITRATDPYRESIE